MSKSSFLNNKKLSKTDIAVICILIMFSGLLFSRFLLSLGMILFGVSALWKVHPREWLKHRWWLWGVAWVALYALTWFWSTDKGEWSVFVQMKLPVLLLPLAFGFLPRFTDKQLTGMTVGAGLLMTGGVAYSLSFLVRDYDQIVRDYNISHVLTTPVYGDYICFSMGCALFAIWSMYMWPRYTSRNIKILMGAITAVLVVYLHILASKSGLVCLYVFLIGYGVYKTIAARSLWGIVGIAGVFLFLALAIKYVPTLHERKAHIVYTYYRLRSGDKSGMLGDLGRLMSYDISLKLMKEQPLGGTGIGDLLADMKKGYDRWYPEVPEVNRLIPHNQFLTVGLGCGIPAMVTFIIWLVMPLARLRRGRDGFYMFIIWFTLFIELMIEPFLEGQFGVFLFIFFLLMIRHETVTSPSPS